MSLPPQTGSVTKVSLQKSKNKLAVQLCCNRKPHLWLCFSALRRKSPGTTSWKPLWTLLTSALLEQKQCREKAKTLRPISNLDGSLLWQRCPMLQWSPDDASQSFQSRCHHYLPAHCRFLAQLSPHTAETSCLWMDCEKAKLLNYL